MRKQTVKKCRICGKKYQGYGHNAEPVNSVFCCDQCQYIVTAERLRRTIPQPFWVGQKVHIIKLKGEEGLTSNRGLRAILTLWFVLR